MTGRCSMWTSSEALSSPLWASGPSTCQHGSQKWVRAQVLYHPKHDEAEIEVRNCRPGVHLDPGLHPLHLLQGSIRASRLWTRPQNVPAWMICSHNDLLHTVPEKNCAHASCLKHRKSLNYLGELWLECPLSNSQSCNSEDGSGAGVLRWPAS